MALHPLSQFLPCILGSFASSISRPKKARAKARKNCCISERLPMDSHGMVGSVPNKGEDKEICTSSCVGVESSFEV